jgi:hypothetical protein
MASIPSVNGADRPADASAEVRASNGPLDCGSNGAASPCAPVESMLDGLRGRRGVSGQQGVTFRSKAASSTGETSFAPRASGSLPPPPPMRPAATGLRSAPPNFAQAQLETAQIQQNSAWAQLTMHCVQAVCEFIKEVGSMIARAAAGRG